MTEEPELKRHPTDFTKPAAAIAKGLLPPRECSICRKSTGKVEPYRINRMVTYAHAKCWTHRHDVQETSKRFFEKDKGSTLATQPVQPTNPKLRPTCTKLKKDGTPCSARCMAMRDGTIAEYCTDHRPQWDKLHADEQEYWLEWSRRAGSTPDTIARAVVSLVGWGQAKQIYRKVNDAEG